MKHPRSQRTTSRGPKLASDRGSHLIDRVVARFRLRARMRTRWLRQLWERMDPVDAALLGADAPDAEAAWHASDPDSQAIAAELRVIEDSLKTSSRLKLLEEIFSLEAAESDLLQACVAVAVEPSLARVCAYLQDDTARTWPTEALVARLYGHPGPCIASPESSLRRWELVRVETIAPADPESLVCDPLIRDWLLGDNRLDEALVGVASLRRPLAPLPSWPVADCVRRVSRSIQDGERVRVCIA